jgi:uncharacterized membrane protein YtjA (UPF0391 family)
LEAQALVKTMACFGISFARMKVRVISNGQGVSSGRLARICMRSKPMLHWAVVFLIVALIAAIFGFGGLAGTAAGIAKFLFVLFVILFLISLVLGRSRTPVV